LSDQDNPLRAMAGCWSHCPAGLRLCASARLRRSTAPSRRVGKDTPTRTMNAAIARNRRAHFESLTY
jgi:hypothetical protein